MMRTIRLLTNALLLLALVAPAVAAQDRFRSRELRQRIESAFAQRLRVELGLTDAQDQRVRQVSREYALRRLDLEDRQMELRRALGGQMRPGVAANQDSVAKLTDALLNARVAYVQTYQDELKDLATVLTPLQRAQFLILRDRVLERAQEMREMRPQARRP